MSNDEARMTNAEGNPNVRMTNVRYRAFSSFGICHSFVIRHSFCLCIVDLCPTLPTLSQRHPRLGPHAREQAATRSRRSAASERNRCSVPHFAKWTADTLFV